MRQTVAVGCSLVRSALGMFASKGGVSLLMFNVRGIPTLIVHKFVVTVDGGNVITACTSGYSN